MVLAHNPRVPASATPCGTPSAATADVATTKLSGSVGGCGEDVIGS